MLMAVAVVYIGDCVHYTIGICQCSNYRYPASCRQYYSSSIVVKIQCTRSHPHTLASLLVPCQAAPLQLVLIKTPANSFIGPDICYRMYCHSASIELGHLCTLQHIIT